jgi:hypothetical protein
MSYCPIRASRALLIEPEYVLSKVVVCCLSIAQRAPVLEWEPWCIPQVRPYGRIMLKSGLRWSVTWWRGFTVCRRRLVHRWVLTRAIDHFPIATLDHVDSSGFVVRISPRANPKDRIVVDGVIIGSRVKLPIGFVIAGCLMAAWNMVIKFLRPRWNSELIVVMCCSSCSWAGCSRSSSSSVVNDSVLNRNYIPVRNLSS